MNELTFTLLEATVTLYPADGAGAPVVTAPIWAGLQAEVLTVAERWIKAETRPTGAAFPRRRALVPQYEININRVWALLADSQGQRLSARFDSSKYVLDVVWVEEDSGEWHRRTFYGVTIDHNHSNREVDGGINEDQVFDAESMTTDGGAASVPIPALTQELPFTASWVGPSGSVQVYRYNPVTALFVANIDPSPYVTVVSAHAGTAFSVTFAGGTPAMTVQADDDAVHVGEVVQGAPTYSQMPRLDFFYGLTRLGSVTAVGQLFAAQFQNGTPTSGAGKFEFWAGGSLRASLAADGMVARAFVEDLEDQ